MDAKKTRFGATDIAAVPAKDWGALVEPESRLIREYMQEAYGPVFGFAPPSGTGSGATLLPGEQAMPFGVAGWVLASAISTVVKSGAVTAEAANGIAVRKLTAMYGATEESARAVIAKGEEELRRGSAARAVTAAPPQPVKSREAATAAGGMAMRKMQELQHTLGAERVKLLALEALRGTVFAGQALPVGFPKPTSLDDWSAEERAALLGVAAWLLAAGIDVAVAEAGGGVDRAATNREVAIDAAVSKLVGNYGATDETARAALAKAAKELRLAAVH